MNAEQAKQLNMVDVMARLGYEPVVVRKNGTEYHYMSPFRTETKPSLVVGRGKMIPWVWNDFGDRGGTVIDFILNGLAGITLYISNIAIDHLGQGAGRTAVGKGIDIICRIHQHNAVKAYWLSQSQL